MAGEHGAEYAARMNGLAEEVTAAHDIDLFAEKETDVTPPPPAQSEFLINKEQGDWAEQLVKYLLNQYLSNHIAVEYGRGEDRVSGEPGFREYYRDYHRELADIGKCPDLLLFETDAIDEETVDKIESIEDVPRRNLIETISPAVAGLEVRSSAYVADKYSQHQAERRTEAEAELSSLVSTVSKLSEKILHSSDVEDPDRFQSYVDKAMEYAKATTKAEAPTYYTRAPIKRMAKANLSDSEANEFLETANEIRNVRKTTFGRDYLSYTVKVEDLVVILNWIETHCVPHYYIQVFFDSIYLISFERILHLLSTSPDHDKIYTIERNSKNQMKTTIHINIDEGHCLSTGLQRPTTSPESWERSNGRIENYVSFSTPDGHLEELAIDDQSVRELFRTD